MANPSITLKQVIVVMSVDERMPKNYLAEALAGATEHLHFVMVWDSLKEFLCDLPDISYDEENPKEFSISGTDYPIQ